MADQLPDDSIYIEDPSPALWELVTIALTLEKRSSLEPLLRKARLLVGRGR
jgi:hypothetical protein